MAPRSKLKVALAAEKGFNDVKLKQLKDKKKHKATIKDKRKKGLLPAKKDEPAEEEWEDEEEDDEDDDEESEDEEAENGLFDMEAEESEGDESEDEELGGTTSAAALLNESDTDSESEVEMEAKIQRVAQPKPILKKESKAKPSPADAEGDEEEDDDEESDIALSDLDDMPDSDREDLYVQTRLTINNQPALLAALKRIAIPRDASTTPFSAHQVVVSAEPTGAKIEDISDDLQREQELFTQCLEAAKKARTLFRKEGVPFSRPKDYFAEMVKDDGHMEKVKAKLVEEATNKKAAAEARKQRDLKKFGKQVQVQKLQERSKQKRETLEKIKELKKKRAEHGNDLTNEADMFDVGVDTELNKNGKRGRGGESNGRGANTKRQKKDTKYGFGGKKRNAKSGDAMSSGDLSGFNARKMKSQGGGGGAGGPGGKKKFVKTARLGKSKRQTGGGKR